MRVTIAVRLPDGTVVDRPPTEEELQDIAERYIIALLERSLPGSQVRIKKRSKEKAAVAAGGAGR